MDDIIQIEQLPRSIRYLYNTIAVHCDRGADLRDHSG